VWRAFRRFAGRREYQRLVDLGGGEGYFAALFGRARYKVVVDAVAPALAVAKDRGLAVVQGEGGTLLVNTSCYGLYLRRWLRRAPAGGRLDLDDVNDGHLSRLTRLELEAAIKAAGLKINKRLYFKHFFQPLTSLPARALSGRGETTKGKTLGGGFGRALNAVRIFVAGWDALFFGWIPGGAVIYKLVK
jgi:hypothetical protein